eukprot:jgi/Galph1/2943/GphlegSOOS_G1610.1
MECFSLRLIEHDAVREWLMGRTEVYIPPHLVESSVGICGDTTFGDENERLHFLMRPVGVVDNILIGLKLGGTFEFALPKGFNGVATSKRFVVDLKSFEKLEFHWFSNNTVLVDWMKFPTTEHRIRYLVLFEAPPPGRLPSKLLRSCEIISVRDHVIQEQFAICGPEGDPHALDEQAFNLCNYEREVFYDGLHYMVRSLGVFTGSLRTTDYQKNFERVVPIRTAIHVIRSQKTECLKMAEMMAYSVHGPLTDKLFSNSFIIPTGRLRNILEKEHFMDEYRRYEPKALGAFKRRQLRKQLVSGRKKKSDVASTASCCSSGSTEKKPKREEDKFEWTPRFIELPEENLPLQSYEQNQTDESLSSSQSKVPSSSLVANANCCTPSQKARMSLLNFQDVANVYEPQYTVDELYDMFQERTLTYDFEETDFSELLQNFS